MNDKKIKVQVCIGSESPTEIELDSVPLVGDRIGMGNSFYEVLDVFQGKGGPQIQLTQVG
jgi:hypothetical protein